MTMHPYLVVTASVGILALGLSIALGSLDSQPKEEPYVENFPSSRGPSDQVGAPVERDVSADERLTAVLRSEIAEIKRAVAKAGGLKGDLEKLSREVAYLRRLVEERRGEGIADSAADTAQYSAGDDAAVVEPPELDAGQPQNEDLERIAAIDRVFWAEPTDAQWSYDVTQTVTEVFADAEVPQTELSQVQCHSTLCRVEVEHADATVADEFSLRFPMEVSEELPQASYHSENLEDGAIRVTMYFARDGYDLPEFEQ